MGRRSWGSSPAPEPVPPGTAFRRSVGFCFFEKCLNGTRLEDVSERKVGVLLTDACRVLSPHCHMPCAFQEVEFAAAEMPFQSRGR